MTDLQISIALALAIGWKRMLPNPEADGLKQCWVWTGGAWRVFDYREWNVIGPIAAKFDCFPFRVYCGWRAPLGAAWSTVKDAETPQRAIALAVIEARK
jgi:hypothetical protein